MSLSELRTGDTPWDPSNVKVNMLLELDACLVQRAGGKWRVDVANVVVLDGMVDECLRANLLRVLTGSSTAAQPPQDRWERATVDRAEDPCPSWGLKRHVLSGLAEADAVIEMNSRLSKLYPEYKWSHFSADSRTVALPTPASERAKDCSEGNRQMDVECHSFVGNAAVPGDRFRWHVDSDPAELRSGPPNGDDAFGASNRDPGKPRLVSMLVYLNEAWPLDGGAETLFLDTASDTGVFVRPQPGRVVLMDQDVTHRVSVPADSASVPRYSLVWKLAVQTANGEGVPSLALPQAGPACAFGSAHRVNVMARAYMRA